MVDSNGPMPFVQRRDPTMSDNQQPYIPANPDDQPQADASQNATYNAPASQPQSGYATPQQSVYGQAGTEYASQTNAYAQPGAYGQPAYGQNAYGQATPNGYQQPAPGTQDYAQGANAYAQPQYGQQAPNAPYGQQAYGQQQYAQPQYAQPANPYTQPQPPYGAPQYPAAGYSTKSKMAAGLLGIFLGSLGVHNFYLGYTGKAVAQLLLTLVGWILLGLGPIAAAIWGLVEGILIISSQYGSPWHKDANGQELTD
ncbi:NINE protein [Bifidobacterium sp. SO4]|nr:NINE protein [Bifidobacterium sp. SO4]